MQNYIHFLYSCLHLCFGDVTFIVSCLFSHPFGPKRGCIFFTFKNNIFYKLVLHLDYHIHVLNSSLQITEIETQQK